MSETIAVWFSCGAASAVAAKLAVEKYSATHRVRVVNNPVANEDKDNRRFLRDVEKWCGIEFEYATNPKYPLCDVEDVFERRGYMAGRHGAPCTFHLKKEARQIWERTNQCQHTVMGFTADEQNRHDRFCLTERPLLPVLIDAGITKQDCFQIIRDAGIELPAIYGRGYPNANCIGCVKASSPTYWNHVRQDSPEVFRQRAEQSRRIGARLVRVQNKRIFLDDLDPSARGRDMKHLASAECGIFCEEAA